MRIAHPLWDPEIIKKTVNEAIPPDRVIPRHTDRGHFYGINEAGKEEAVYGSVTTKLQILKDESLINYKMNRANDYVFANWQKFTEENVMDHLTKAAEASAEILEDAGDIGTRIHNYRENYFKKWIESGVRPENILSFIPEAETDIRATSALRALDKFCTEYDYQPLFSELYVYSHKLKTAGTLDDLGLMRKVTNPGDPNCQHELMVKRSHQECLRCDYKQTYEFVLMDIKTSNQFKDHYFFQVALYFWMFAKLTGLIPEKAFILKLSKTDGMYKIEDLKKPFLLSSYARSMMRVDEGLKFIKDLRKDNQKVVINCE